ncbi:MAG TPA: ABC transporter ATP-binding protein [Verrucomicrobiales bacterium]|nr:ABC transporter ATP-binding protein [Verrucomicrobiales bacterium]
MSSESGPALRGKLQRALSEFRLLPRVFALAWRASPRWTNLWLAVILLEGALPVATLYLTRWLVDTLATGGTADLVAGTWLPPFAALAAVLGASRILTAFSGWIRTAQAERLADHITGLIHEKSVSVDLAQFEHAAFYDRLYRASFESPDRSVALLENSGGLVRGAVTVAAMLGVLGSYAWWLPLALLAASLPAVFVVFRYALAQHQLWLQTTAAQRQATYRQWVMTSDLAAAEIRLFGLGPLFRNAYQTIRASLRERKLRLEGRHALAALTAGAASLFIAAAAFALLLARFAQGLYTLGDLALFFQAFTRSQAIAESLVSQTGQLYRNSLYLSSLFEFLALRSDIVTPASPLPPPGTLASGIAFREVDFRYPSSSRLALDKFSLSISAGCTTAILGMNGAGKSTLLKLICRFYDPESGRVEIDGADLRQLDLEAWRNRISVLFQQPFHYQAAAVDNIAYGRLEVPAGEIAHAAQQAAREAGADRLIQELPGGYHAQLGKWFAEGTELSTGEWQRIALARAFFRNAPVLLLDEPTSAMDPWEEAEWLDRFYAYAQGRTAILVTHRLTTAMRADHICVLDHGRLIEEGTHLGLLASEGAYARAWRGRPGA